MTDEYSLEMDRERQRLAETMAAETELMIRKAERGQWTQSAEMRTKRAEIENGGRWKPWIVLICTALLVLSLPPVCGIGGGSYSDIPAGTVEALEDALTREPGR